MPVDQADNPVTRSLNQLGLQWKAFEETSEAVLGIWRVGADQSRMIDAMVYLEDTEQKVVPSIFLTFESGFQDPETYAYELIKEFLTQIAHPTSRLSLEEGGVNFDQLIIDEIRDTKAWLKLLSDFAKMVKPLTGHFVPYLLPKTVSDEQAWLKWVEKLLNLDVPSKIRIMVKEDERRPLFETLVENYPERTQVLVPDLDMGNIIQEVLAEATKNKENEPGVQLQQLMIRLDQTVTRLQMSEAEQYAAQAVEMAGKEGWAHLQVIALFTLANGYIGGKNFDKAVESYRKARQIAADFGVKEPQIGKQLEIQAIMGEAGCYLGKQDFATGAVTYAQAAPLAREIDKPHLELEAWRMTAFCRHYLKDHTDAWGFYRKALETGEKIDPELRPSTTLPYVGQALLELRSKSGTDQKQYELEEEINALLGENWQTLIKTT